MAIKIKNIVFIATLHPHSEMVEFKFQLHDNGEKSRWQLFGNPEVLVQLNY